MYSFTRVIEFKWDFFVVSTYFLSMLEVINGYLFVYFTTLCTLSALITYLIKPLALCFNKPSNDERKIWAQIVNLKAEQKQYSLKDEFAAYSKLQRKIYKLENDLKDITQTRRTKGQAMKSFIQIISQVVIAFVIVVSIIWFRREPIVVLKGNLFPLTNMLRYPSDTPNAISTHIWVVISNVSIRTLLKPFTS